MLKVLCFDCGGMFEVPYYASRPTQACPKCHPHYYHEVNCACSGCMPDDKM